MKFCSGLRVAVMAVCVSTLGCHHKVKVAAVALPPPATVPLVPAPEPAKTPQVPQQPVVPTPVPTQPVQPPVKKRRKKVEPPPPAPPASAPVQVAGAGSVPDASVIGALTAGGDASPAQRQKASDAISAVEKRLGVLSGETQRNQEQGILRVRNFLRQAGEALKSGDAEGALNLASKAKVLLDDLLK